MNVRMKIRINRKNIWMLMLAFISFPPYILERLSSATNLFQKSAQIVCIGLLLILIIKQRAFKIENRHLFWILFLSYGFGLTFILRPDGLYSYVAAVLFRIALPILLSIYLSFEKKDLIRFFDCIVTYSLILIFINAITMLAFPNGIIQSSIGSSQERANWIFGSKNNIVFPLVFISVFLVAAYLRNNKNIYIIGLILGFTELACTGEINAEFMGGSSTGIVILLAFVFLVLIRGKHRVMPLFKYVSIFRIEIIFILISAVVVYFTVVGSDSLGSLFDVLGKDATITGRNRVWEVVLYRISNAPIWGYGYIPSSDYIVGTLFSSYSFFLDNLYRYGLIGILLISFTFKAYGNNKVAIYQNSFSYLFFCGVTCLFIGGVVNTIRWDYLVMLLEMYILFRDNTNLLNIET